MSSKSAACGSTNRYSNKLPYGDGGLKENQGGAKNDNRGPRSMLFGENSTLYELDIRLISATEPTH